MRNAHGLITGLSGTGKTTFVRDQLLPAVPRWVALDRQGDYRGDRDVRELERFGKILALHGGDPRFRVVFSSDSDRAHLAVMEMLYTAFGIKNAELRRPRWPPLLVVMDEAWMWSSSRELPDELAALVRSGRKYGLAVLSIAHRDINVHPDIRLHSEQRIAFAQDAGFSSDFAKSWFAGRLEQVAALEIPDGRSRPRPEKGRHYLTSPPGLEPVAFWQRHITATAKNKPEKRSSDQKPPGPERLEEPSSSS